MAEFDEEDIDPAMAKRLLKNQKLYTAAQRKMAKEHPHLIWVNAKKKVARNG